ncbi:MAG: tRNA (adenosine(37)-N6)-threonylcarbamoyltransferase complex dimerization subunit type 1 TsaB [Prosthecochloris sp.]|nr:tRNA (adenosine(37)-N6)-threonylcarbamoyltransferase complex dimerization subunit type 1 TsaB [Prosthecochloris sp.]
MLAIECSHRSVSVACSDGHHVTERCLDAWQKTAESMVPLAGRVLDEAGLKASELDAVAVSAGPGSFTALRIGMATAKGLAFGVNVPLLPVSTMEALAVCAARYTGQSCVVPLIPARKDEYYYTLWQKECREEWDEFRDISYAPVGAIAASVCAQRRDCVVTCREPDAVRHVLLQSGMNVVPADFFTASALLPLALADLAAGRVRELADIVPAYHQVFRPRDAGL